MSIKKHLITGTMIGGMLLAATVTPLRVVALSDDPSNTNTPPSSTSQTTSPQDNDDSTGPNQGSTPANTPPAGGDQQSNTNNSGDPSSGNGTNGSSNSDNQNSTPPVTPDDTSSAPTDGSNNTPNVSGAPDGTNSPDNSPTSNTNSDPSASAGSGNTQNNTNNNIGDGTDSDATSGNVNVLGNESVGNVSSGSAKSSSTTVNSLQSTSSLTNAGNLQTFSIDINGDYNGDYVLSPADILPAAPSSAVQNPGSANINNETGDTITNDENLSANSGNVTAEGNESTGNLNSGDAATEANIINMINSVVTDQKAFVGNINVNGNLDGNILLPSSFVSSILSSEPSSSNGTKSGSSNTTTTNNNMNVNNNVTVNAQSGGVTVEGNGSTGNISSGNSSTSVQLYNLTNSDVVGGNVLLVFVNVMGSWVGLLMNAPAGTTSAALGGGITQDSVSPNGSTTTDTTETINNNVNLKSQSGDVAAKGNESTGNVGSGNASANADIVNIMGSQVDLSGWLGVLIINVYGSWNGSLEIQPAGVTIHIKAPAVSHHTTPHHKKKTVASTNIFTIDPSTEFALANSSDSFAANTGHVLGRAIARNTSSGVKHVALVDSTKARGKGTLADFVATALALLLAGALATGRALHIRKRKLN